MNQELADRLGDEFIRIGKDFKAGNSHLTEEAAMDLLRDVIHQEMSREEVCDEFNINNTKFYEMIILGQIPAGRKKHKRRDMYWYRDEIEKAINKLRNRK